MPSDAIDENKEMGDFRNTKSSEFSNVYNKDIVLLFGENLFQFHSSKQ